MPWAGNDQISSCLLGFWTDYVVSIRATNPELRKRRFSALKFHVNFHLPQHQSSYRVNNKRVDFRLCSSVRNNFLSNARKYLQLHVRKLVSLKFTDGALSALYLSDGSAMIRCDLPKGISLCNASSMEQPVYLHQKFRFICPPLFHNECSVLTFVKADRTITGWMKSVVFHQQF